MQSRLPSAVATIKRLMGLSDKHTDILMPQGDNSTMGFPGVTLNYQEDETSWAQREYDKDHKGWEIVP